jgi:hypothetical protein
MSNRFSVIEYLGFWLLMEDGRLRQKFRSRQQAVRVRDYLAGQMPADDAAVWDVVAAGLAKDAGFSMENHNE